MELSEDVIVELQRVTKDERSSPAELLQVIALLAISRESVMLESAWRWLGEGEEIRRGDEQLASGGTQWIPATRIGEKVLYPRTHRRRLL